MLRLEVHEPDFFLWENMAESHKQCKLIGIIGGIHVNNAAATPMSA
jgi:hypothetical protein